MAGEATIGALRVVLGADTAKFEDSLNKAGKSLNNFSATLGKIGAVAGVALVAGLASVAASIKGVIDQADKMGKVSQKFGVPVETLSALAHAAELSDVSLEQLGSSLGKLSRNMISAQNATSEQATAFRALGISIRDNNGQLKSSDQILLEVADAFSKFEDGATKTALALSLFGKAGADMIPLLNQGAAGIQKLQQEAQRLGFTIDDKTAKAAELFNDNLKTLSKTTDAMLLRVLGSSGLLVAMAQLSSRFVESASGAKEFETIGNALGRTIQLLTIYFDALGLTFNAILLPFRVLAQAFAAAAKGDFAGAWKAVSDRFKETGASATQLLASIRNLNQGFVDQDNTGDQVLETMNKLAAAYARMGATPVFDPAAAKKAASSAKEFEDAINRLRGQALETSGAFAGQLAPGFLAAAAGMEHLKGQVIIVHGRLVALGPAAKQFNQAMLEVEGAKLTQEFLAPWLQYEQQLQRINLLLANQKISSEVAAQASLKAATDLATSYGQTAQAIVSPMADAFKTLATMNKKYAGIAKAAAIGEAIVNTYLAATKALASVPPPFNFAAAAAVTAAGLANVAKISQTEFAHGGSFKVGGVGGTDSQLVHFMATPGEMVDVRTPGQGRDVGAGGVQIIELKSPRMRDFFSEHVRDLVAVLNQAAPDGYVLKVT